MEISILVKVLKREVGCDFIPCDSSNILCYGYKKDKKELWVAFKGEVIYCYMDISKELFDELTIAESKGKWVNANLVKPKIPSKRYAISG